MRARRLSRIEGIGWCGLGAALCVGAVRLGLGTAQRPGPGLIPFLTGAGLALFGLLLWVRRDADGSTGLSLKRLVGSTRSAYALTLFLYPLLLWSLGFVLDTLLWLFVLFTLLERGTWLRAMVISVVTVLLGYLVFAVWLRIDFPGGLLGIG